jgi:hypothetical protein
MRISLVVVAALCLPLTASAKKARPRPTVEGLTEVHRIEPAAGFVELATAHDGVDTFAYVVADAAAAAEVHVVQGTTELRTFDISGLTLEPRRLWLVGKGKKAKVLVTADDDGAVIGALYDAAGKEELRLGPAASIAIVRRAGKQVLVVKTVTAMKDGREIHAVQRYDLGRRKARKLGKAKKLVLKDGKNARLAFTLHHWSDEGTVAVGITEGDYNKKEDRQMPDREGRFDLLGGKLVSSDLGDRMAHAKRFEILLDHTGHFRVASDLSGVEVWRDERPTTVQLDQPFELYDPKSLVGDETGAYFALQVDPWNRPAVKRKRADAVYFDVFAVDDAGKATRVARIPAEDKSFTFGRIGDRFWVIERNAGFRGGKSLVFYAAT